MQTAIKKPKRLFRTVISDANSHTAGVSRIAKVHAVLLAVYIELVASTENCINLEENTGHSTILVWCYLQVSLPCFGIRQSKVFIKM